MGVGRDALLFAGHDVDGVIHGVILFFFIVSCIQDQMLATAGNSSLEGERPKTFRDVVTIVFI